MGAPYSAVLAEGTIGARRLILNVNATDADSGTNAVVMYGIAGGGSAGNFEIDSVTVSLQCHTMYTILKGCWKYCRYGDFHMRNFHMINSRVEKFL